MSLESRESSDDAAPADCDVLIVGGGLVGSALAAALEPLPIRTVVIEARRASVLEQPSFDSRVTALARGTQRILSALGVWDAIAADAAPILTIHVSERGRFGATRIRATEEGVPALGYTVENRVLGRVLWDRIDAAEHCTVISPAKLITFHTDADGVTATLEKPDSRDSSPARVSLRARLLVAADGAESPIREALGIGVREDRYDQQALIVNCSTDLPHRGVAFERFMASGPLAMLPLCRERMGTVWTLPSARASVVAAMTDDEFRAALQRAFGHRLGRIARVGVRSLYPLRRVRSERLGAQRTALIGNAAVSLHPVAGQGFNLALRDIAALAELIAEAAAKHWHHTDDIVARYQRWRTEDQQKVARFTHGLVGLFGGTAPGLGLARGLGLVALDVLPGAKSAFARHTMGVAGRLPRLARGLPLVADG